MTDPQVSVVIVSRHRSTDLRRCLAALRLQFYHEFEVIVVCDPQSAEMLDRDRGTIRIVEFDEPNISRARNIGIAQASGALIAFIDDDAVAEPTWLSRLIAPFENETVVAATGYVRGRNGISYQWKAEHIGEDGMAVPFDVSGIYLSDPQRDQPLKAHGTNAIFRASTLRALGGFDENYRFYMDETDLCRRIWNAGGVSVVVPDAQVHHYYSASDMRRSDRTPTNLREIGASYAYFLNKHGLDASCLAAFKRAQRERLIARMMRGDLEPFEVNRLLKQLEHGMQEGASRTEQRFSFPDEYPDFQRFQGSKCITTHKSMKCSWIRRRTGHEVAADCASENRPVTLFVFSLSALFHQRSFHTSGYWVQSGGIFGKSDRDDRIFRFYTAQSRMRRELDEIRKYRSQ